MKMLHGTERQRSKFCKRIATKIAENIGNLTTFLKFVTYSGRIPTACIGGKCSQCTASADNSPLAEWPSTAFHVAYSSRHVTPPEIQWEDAPQRTVRVLCRPLKNQLLCRTAISPVVARIPPDGKDGLRLVLVMCVETHGRSSI